jgi:GT2 family glycosyltransferase
MSIQPGLVSVIVINFNSSKYIERCMEAIKAQSYPLVEVLIIDNGSTDGSLALVRRIAQEYPLRLFEGANVGFSKANNLGFRESSGEFVLVLNSDAFPATDYLDKCVAAFGDDDWIGTVIGKLVSDSDPTMIDSAGLYVYREGFSIDRGMGEKDRGQYDRQEFVDGACGAAAIYRRTMLEDVRIGDEYFDEDFFTFVEDGDLSLRSGIRGWTTLYVPSAVARHVRGGSTSKLTEFTNYLNERNTRLFLRKSFSLVARPSDKVLQSIVLLGRMITQFKHLSASSRGKLRKEIKELQGKMDRKRDALVDLHHASAFCMQGRRSYLAATILRGIGISMPLNRNLHSDCTDERYSRAHASGLPLDQASQSSSPASSLPTILPIVVLYNCTLENAVTYQTFLVAAKHAALDPSLIAVYDNSPIRQVSPAEELHLLAYKHDPSNGLLAAAYNWALEIAGSRGFSWLLLLNHDSALPPEFMASLAGAAQSYELDPSVVAIVPFAMDRNRMISPKRVRFGRLAQLPASTPVVTEYEITAIAAGTAIKASFLRSLGGFSLDYPFDFIDHWLFRKIYAQRKKVALSGSVIEHDLAAGDYRNKISPSRYHSILTSEVRFITTEKRWLERPVYLIRLMLRAVKQLIVSRRPELVAITCNRVVEIAAGRMQLAKRKP